jgi:hypothetical protein
LSASAPATDRDHKARPSAKVSSQRITDLRNQA